jgi:hypothetical protein
MKTKYIMNCINLPNHLQEMSTINKNNGEILTFYLSKMKVHPCGLLGPRSTNNASTNHVQLSLVFASITAIDIGYILLLASLPIASLPIAAIKAYHMPTPISEAVSHGYHRYVHPLESIRHFEHRSLNHQKYTTPNICASNCCTIVS